MIKRFIVPIITSCIIIFIICAAAQERKSLQAYEFDNIPAMAEEIRVIQAATLSANDEEKIPSGTITYLQDYLKSSLVDLGDKNADELKELIRELRFIFTIEKENELDKMTIDGREIAVNLLKRIYAVCGATLEYNLSGEIERVEDPGGNILYQNKNQVPQGNFEMGALLLVLTVILALLTLGIILTQKSQIFAGDVIFDGFDEQEYA
ncbi:MAG: hypothetical protein E7255_02785 [Lachnospiraceae bacterium]|jgi:hypothetical protein|nr:hypothetical protein [Lachnospiraceae bacterium]